MDTTVNATAVSGHQREYLFDNYKVLLILLVVIGHFIEPSNDQNPFLYELKWGIVAFHMPAFIFISGYFSKRIPSLKKMLCGLVIPYFVYEILYYLLYTFILDKETGFYFTRPKFSLWYLMALFAWRLLSPLIEKIPGCMVLSVIAGILIGFTDFGNFLSIPRILFFFPFFLAGKKFDSSSLARFRNRKGYLCALTILGSFAVFLFTGQVPSPSESEDFLWTILLRRYGYEFRRRRTCPHRLLSDLFSSDLPVHAGTSDRKEILLLSGRAYHGNLYLSRFRLQLPQIRFFYSDFG